MIQLTKDLWMDADENQYVVGKLYQTVRRDRCLHLRHHVRQRWPQA